MRKNCVYLLQKYRELTCAGELFANNRKLTLYRQAMIDEFDLDQDGEINLEEFLAIMLDGE